MIVENGLLSEIFNKYENNDKIFLFETAVSNSKETLKSDFLLEKKLLIEDLINFAKDRKFIYFSTCSIYDTYSEISDYTKHKIAMENLVTNKSNNYIIIRLPQIIGKNSENQLIAFLFNSIQNEKIFKLYDIERNVIAIDDVEIIFDYIVNDNTCVNKIINIANSKNIKVLDLVLILEKIIQKKANFNIINMNGNLNIDIDATLSFINNKNLFKNNYIERKIRKYYE